MSQLSAEQYDAFHAGKDYEREAHWLHELLSRLDPSLHTLLNVACSTGAHDEHLCRFYEVDGLDPNADFLEAARRRNGNGTYQTGDMRSFRLDRLYDVVLCLFGSIGHVRTAADLQRALKTFHDHLTPRGVVVIEPWLTPDEWSTPSTQWHQSGNSALRIGSLSRCLTRHEEADAISVVEHHYLIGNDDDVSYTTATEERGLFSQRQLESALVQAGFQAVQYENDGPTDRGLFVGRHSSGYLSA